MFYCKFCSFKDSTLNCYLKHVKEHSSLTNKLVCGFNHCNKIYTVSTSILSHVRRCHNTKVKVTNNISPPVINNSLISQECTVQSCTQKYMDQKHMIIHLNKHIYDGTTIKCGYLNCEKTYNKVNSFSSHI